MIGEILVVSNPAKKKKKKETKKKTTKKKSASTGSKKPAKKKETKKMAEQKKKKRKSRKKNPVGKRTRRRAKQTFLGMDFGKTFSNLAPHLAGMLAANVLAKKFPGLEGGTDRMDWTPGNYLGAGLGAILAGALAENIRRGWGQKVFQGGMDLVFYKLLINEIAYKNPTLESWFGQDEPIHPDYLGDGYGDFGELAPPDELGFGQDPMDLPDDTEEDVGAIALGDDGEEYVKGVDGYWRPVDESDRIVSADMGFDDELSPPGPLGDAWSWENIGEDGGPDDPFARAYH